MKHVPMTLLVCATLSSAATAAEQNYLCNGVVVGSAGSAGVTSAGFGTHLQFQFGFSQNYDSVEDWGNGTAYTFFNSPGSALTDMRFDILSHQISQDPNSVSILFMRHNRPMESDLFQLVSQMDAEPVSGAFDVSSYLAAHPDADIHYQASFSISGFDLGSEDIPQSLPPKTPAMQYVDGSLDVFDGDAILGHLQIGYTTMDPVPEPATISVIGCGFLVLVGRRRRS